MFIHFGDRDRFPCLARLGDVDPQLKLEVKLLRRSQGCRPITLVLTIDETCEATDWGSRYHYSAGVTIVACGHVVEWSSFLKGGIDHVLDLGGVNKPERAGGRRF